MVSTMKGLLVLVASLVVATPPPREAPMAAAARAVEALLKRDQDAWTAVLHPALPAEEAAFARSLYELAGMRRPVIVPLDPFPENRSRAVVPLRLRTDNGVAVVEEILHLFLVQSGGSWKVLGFHPEPKVAREWLYEPGKPGAGETPELTLGTFLIALRRGDGVTAERVCTNGCWDGHGPTARSLFEAARVAAHLDFSAERVEIRGERAMARMIVAVGDQPAEPVDFYLIHREEGWLIAGFGREEDHGPRFLEGEVGPNPWPPSPAPAAEYLVRAMEDRLLLRVRAICLQEALRPEGSVRTLFGLLSGELATVRLGEAKEPRGGRALARLELENVPWEEGEELWLMLSHTRDGWRVAGATPQESVAFAFQTGGSK